MCRRSLVAADLQSADFLMIAVPDDLRHNLRKHGQEHVLAWWDELHDNEKRELVQQLQKLDLNLLRQLHEARRKQIVLRLERIVPVPRSAREPTLEGKYRSVALQAWRKGWVAYLVVAGGQGSRLGFDHPKGMFPIGPVSNNSLFQIHAEKVGALKRRHGATAPFLVMTSPSTDAETKAFFAEHEYFGLERDEVFFFGQGTMPALDYETGKLLLESKGRLFTSPNGHGGTLTALADSGLLDHLKGQGIRAVYYFQVDNPLVNLADGVFLGEHLDKNSQVSSKVIAKENHEEKMGVFVLLDGQLTIIEYSDLPTHLARQEEEPGKLRFWAGNPAIHLFAIDFLEEVTRGSRQIPWHLAHKKVPFLGPDGNLANPEKENALKFEKFIFDVLPLADRWMLLETERADEFMPVKNATGPDSPATARQGMSNQAGNWLERAGVRVPRKANGDVAIPLEISPLFALAAEQLVGKVQHGARIEESTYLFK